MSNTIDLKLIFPIQFSSAGVLHRQRVELTLNLPSTNTRRVPIRRVAPVSNTAPGGEWSIEFAGKATVAMRLDSGQLPAMETSEVNIEFEIGVAEPIPFTPTSSQTTPLLYGSIVIDRQDFRIPNVATNFRRILANCWPTGELDEIEQFRFEPSGFYLVGKIPQGLIDLDLAGQSSIPTSWALRVPQPAPAADEQTAKIGQRSVTILPPGVEPKPPVALAPRRWVLTNEAFLKDGQPLLNAGLFTQTVAQQFHGFSLSDGRSLVDSIASNPERNATVDIHELNTNQLTWRANGIGTRIVIGGLEAGEAQFDPQQLSGEIHRENGTWHHHHTTFSSLSELGPSEKYVQLELKRGANPAQERVDVEFPREIGAITATNVPALGTDKSLPKDGPPGERSPVTQRTWMCIEQGWLGIDTDHTSANLAPQSTKAGPLGLIELDRLLHSLTPGAVDRGFSVNLLPVANKHVALSLNGIGRNIQRLRISEPVVLLTTPPVFHLDPPVDQVNPTASAIRSSLWVPSLAARLEQDATEGKLEDPETILRRTLVSSEWISTHATQPVFSKVETQRSGSPEKATWEVTKVPEYQTLFKGQQPGKVWSRLIIRHKTKPEQWCVVHLPKIIEEEGKIAFGKVVEKSDAFAVSGFSAGVKEIYPSRQRRLTALVSWKQGSGFEMTLPVEKNQVVLWAQPTKLPLLCTFPRPGADTPAIVMDDQRSQIPYELKVDNLSLDISFPANRLPPMDTEFVLSGTPSNDWRAVETAELMMLTTLPGMEAQISNDQLKWRLRHATPVLDEAYLEVRESESEINQPQPAESFDTTRVEQTAVFDIGPVGSSVISNWLPVGSPFASNLVIIKSFVPTGANPKLTVELANGKDVSFSRCHEPVVESAGLTAALKKVVTPSGSGQLPAFDVSFTTNDPDIQIRREGQPLLVSPDTTHSLVTMDGQGVVRGEPTKAETRFRVPNAASDQLRLTASCHDTGLELDLIGIEQGAFAQTFHRTLQQWMLHDGKGGWPLLNGFAMYPVNLSLKSLTAAEIDVVLAPLGLTSKQLIQNPTAVVSTKISLQEPNLSIDSFDGRFQWRFEPDESRVASTMQLVGVAGTIAKAVGQSPLITINEVILLTELGIIRLPGLTVSATIDTTPGSEKIDVPAIRVRIPNASNQFGLLVSLAKFSIRSADHTPTVIDGEFTWERPPNQASGITYAITYVAGQSATWRMEVRVPDAAGGGNTMVVIPYKLTPTRTDSTHFLFQAEADVSSLPVFAKTLFALKSSSGFLTAQFNREMLLTEFGGDLLFELSTATSNGSSEGKLLGRLSVAERGDPVIECSGVMTLESGIAWEHDPTNNPITHVATFFVDYARQPLLCLIQGRHVGDSMSFACVVRHRMVVEGKIRAEWQTPQTARWMSFAEYKAIFQPSGQSVAAASDHAAVLEASAVIWIEDKVAEHTIPRTDGRGVDLEADRFGFAIRIRDTDEIAVDQPGHVIRLPFAAVNGVAPPVHTITVNGVAGLPVSSKGSQHQPLFFAPQSRSAQVAYLFRSAQALHVDADSLQGLLRSLDAPTLHSVPAYPQVGDSDNSTVALPIQLDDLAAVFAFPLEEPLHLAATLVRRYPFEKQSSIRRWWNRHGQVLAGATLLQTMCHLEDMPSDGAIRPVFAQLIAVRSAQFQPLAQKTFETKSPTEQDLQNWASEILATQPLGTVSFILRDYSSFIRIPSGYARRREDLPDSWAFPESNAAMPIDPRARIPGPTMVPTGGQSLPSERLEALSNRTLFAVQADVPVTEATDRPVIAATHVRLASIHDDEQPQGTLRQATTSATRRTPGQKEAHYPQLNWTQWDSVDFLASRDQHYPTLDGSALSNLPLTSFAAEHDTVMPPLMHVVTWASRPGEMTTTQWGYEELDMVDGGQVSRRGLPSAVELRRPRAQSGRHESMRLNPSDSSARRPVFGGRLHYVNTDLEQTLGISPPPQPASVNAVLSNRETFFVSHTQPDVAKQESAMVFALSKEKLETLRFTLFAEPLFNPDAIPNLPDPDLRTQTFLFLTIDKTEVPRNYPDNATDGPTDVSGVVMVRKLPPLSDHFWSQHPSAKCFTATIEDLSELVEKRLTTPNIPPKLEILLFRYKHDPTQSSFVREEQPIFAISISVLKPSAAFLLPKMSVSLLGIHSSGDAYLAGYGRLNSSNFTLPTHKIDSSNGLTISWVRYAKVTALDRREANQFDIIVYGAGGDLIPTIQ